MQKRTKPVDAPPQDFELLRLLEQAAIAAHPSPSDAMKAKQGRLLALLQRAERTSSGPAEGQTAPSESGKPPTAGR